MYPRLVFALLVGLMLVLTGCGGPDYIKMGDAAAASGNWRGAEANYRTALTEKPNEPGLAEKHANARQRALDEARSKAQTLQAGGDEEAALTEVDYALTLAPGDTELVEMRTALARNVALAKLSAAREAADGGRFDDADKLVAAAQALTTDTDVVNEANRLANYIPMKRAQKMIADADAASGKSDYVAAAKSLRAAIEATTDESTVAQAREKLAALADPAADEAMRLAGIGDHAKAVPLAELAAELNPDSYASLADGIRTVHTDKEQQEFDRLRREAAGEFGMFHWAAAAALLKQALEHGTSERVKAQLEFCNRAMAAEAAVTAKDWATAETELTAALNTGEDPNSWAKMELERVAVKPWRVSFGHLLISPTNASSMTWSGQLDTRLHGISGQLREQAANLKADAPSPDAVKAIEGLAAKVDAGMQPTLQVRITLPDGKVVAPADAPGTIWTPALGGWFVVSANQADDRTVTVAVQHKPEEGDATTIGTITIRLGDLVTEKAMLRGDAGVISLRVATSVGVAEEVGTMADTLVDPNAVPTTPTDPPANPESAWHVATARPWPHGLELVVESENELDAAAMDAVIADLKVALATAAGAAALGNDELANAGRYNSWRKNSTKVEVQFVVTGDIMEYETKVFDIE